MRTGYVRMLNCQMYCQHYSLYLLCFLFMPRVSGLILKWNFHWIGFGRRSACLKVEECHFVYGKVDCNIVNVSHLGKDVSLTYVNAFTLR